MSQVFSVCFGAFNAGDIYANPWNNGSLDIHPGKKAALWLELRNSSGILRDPTRTFAQQFQPCIQNSPEEFHILCETWKK